MTPAQASIRRSQIAARAREPGWVFCSTCGGEDPDCFDCDGQGGWYEDQTTSPPREEAKSSCENFQPTDWVGDANDEQA